jgi:hypothetical protein
MMMRRGYLLLLGLVLLLASCGNGTSAKPPATASSSAAAVQSATTAASTAGVQPATTPITAPISSSFQANSTTTPPASAPPTTAPAVAPTPTANPTGSNAISPEFVAPTPTTAAPPATASANGCSLGVVETLSGESSSDDEAKTASWSIQHENGWTLFTPGGDWHLSTSSQGLDVLSPDGGSDASLASWPSTTPWTYQSLAANILGSVSNIQVICQSPNESSASGETEATEITGVYQGQPIHAVIVLSLLTPTTAGFYDGQTRSIYTPASQWSTDSEATLWLIVKRAILNPSGP